MRSHLSGLLTWNRSEIQLTSESCERVPRLTFCRVSSNRGEPELGWQLPMGSLRLRDCPGLRRTRRSRSVTRGAARGPQAAASSPPSHWQAQAASDSPQRLLQVRRRRLRAQPAAARVALARVRRTLPRRATGIRGTCPRPSQWRSGRHVTHWQWHGLRAPRALAGGGGVSQETPQLPRLPVVHGVQVTDSDPETPLSYSLDSGSHCGTQLRLAGKGGGRELQSFKFKV